METHEEPTSSYYTVPGAQESISTKCDGSGNPVTCFTPSPSTCSVRPSEQWALILLATRHSR